MIPEQTLYRLAFFVSLGIAGTFLLWVVRSSSRTRRYLLPAPLLLGTLAASNFGMSIEFLTVEATTGEVAPLSRHVEYMLAWPTMAAVAGLVAGATKRQLVALVAFVFLAVACIVGSYLTGPPTNLAFMGGSTVLLLVIAYLFVWPITARSGEQSDERALLYGKLRNLLLLMWIVFLFVGTLSRQGLGLLDAFTGVVLATYLDLIFRVGFGAILIRSTDAVEQTVADSVASSDSSEEAPFEEPTEGGSAAG